MPQARRQIENDEVLTQYTLGPAAVKRQITEDWLGCFPGLGIHKPLWLLRRIGPLVCGICLDRDSGNDAYRPTFHVHNLSKPSTTVTLTLADRLRTVKTGAPETIRVAFHEQRFADAAKRLGHQASIPLSGPVRLDDCLKAYRAYMQQPLGRYPLPLFEDIVTLFVWCDQGANAESVLREAAIQIVQWPESTQPENGVELWVKQLRNWIENPDKIRSCVAEQTESLKLQRLPHSNILL